MTAGIGVGRHPGWQSRPFLRNVVTLMTGTAVAQGVIVLATPVLARLYTPADFGAFGLFSAVFGLIGMVAGLRFELAIPIAGDEEDAQSLVGVAGLAVVGTSIATAIAIAVFGAPLAEAFDGPLLSRALWWAPLWILAFGMFQVMTFWSSRVTAYRRVSGARVVRSASVVGAQLGLAGIASGASGLIAGFALGHSFGSGRLALVTWRASDWERAAFAPRRLARAMRRYRDFATFGAPSMLLSGIGNMLPPVVLGFAFGPAVAGAYWFVWRLLQLPSEVVGQSVRQVLLQQGAAVPSAPTLARLLNRTTAVLGLAGIGPVIVIIAGGPGLFGSLFGSDWLMAGDLARWIALPWLLALMSQPALTALAILERQRAHLLLEAILILLRATSLVVGVGTGSPILTVVLFSVASAAGHLLPMALLPGLIRAARRDDRSGRWAKLEDGAGV